jgi:hypothetical protein
LLASSAMRAKSEASMEGAMIAAGAMTCDGGCWRPRRETGSRAVCCLGNLTVLLGQPDCGPPAAAGPHNHLCD